MLSNLENFNKFIEERNKFSNDTFGSPAERGCRYPLLHLKDEIQELLDAPDDPMEWADCFLLLLDAAWRKGHTVDDLIDFASEKLKINKQRKWKKTEEGYYKHI